MVFAPNMFCVDYTLQFPLLAILELRKQGYFAKVG